MKQGNKIRVGIIGVLRGQSFMQSASELPGMELVAFCDLQEDKLHELGAKYNVTTYTDYDRFIEHDMDAVVLANYFHEHAPFAIKALGRGLHVMSETSCNATLAEGVALCQAVEKSGKIYMLAENYPYTVFSQEMRRLYHAGEVGEAVYADGEYCHPMPPSMGRMISPTPNHWRRHLPPTYYCTHSLAPLMYITDLEPVAINAVTMDLFQPTMPEQRENQGSIILCTMNNGAVFKLAQGTPGHSIWYRLHGTEGAMESTRGPGYFGPQQVRVWHDEWKLKDGQVTEKVYMPEWPEYAELAKKAGHGGGDLFTILHFENAIRTGIHPYLDVYRGVIMSSVGILARKSALEKGKSLKMLNFRDKVARKPYVNEHWSPFPPTTGPG